jgi:Holliday junction resolvase RusA-like endonuclease
LIDLVVYGNPAPQGSKKFIGTTSMGRGVIVDSSPKTKPWRADVKAACEAFMEKHQDFTPFTDAVSVRMVFTFIRPKSVTPNKRRRPSTYPDLSKLCRATEDAISSSGLWRDDALVVEYTRLAKVYADEDLDSLPRPGCALRIEEAPRAVIMGKLQKRLEIEAA